MELMDTLLNELKDNGKAKVIYKTIKTGNLIGCAYLELNQNGECKVSVGMEEYDETFEYIDIECTPNFSNLSEITEEREFYNRISSVMAHDLEENLKDIRVIKSNKKENPISDEMFAIILSNIYSALDFKNSDYKNVILSGDRGLLNILSSKFGNKTVSAGDIDISQISIRMYEVGLNIKDAKRLYNIANSNRIASDATRELFLKIYCDDEKNISYSDEIKKLAEECMFSVQPEDENDILPAWGICVKFGFDKKKINKNRDKIIKLIEATNIGYPMSSLELLMQTKTGECWNNLSTFEEFEILEKLLALGTASGKLSNSEEERRVNIAELNEDSLLLSPFVYVDFKDQEQVTSWLSGMKRISNKFLFLTKANLNEIDTPTEFTKKR